MVKSLLAALFLVASVLAAPLAAADAEASQEAPQYGGTLNIGTVYVTLSALSWDIADWAWKGNHDAGSIREVLMAGDLDKSIRKGGKYPFTPEAYLPDDSLRGELAESWEWEENEDGSFQLVVHLRRGIMFTEKPGIMKARELVADDVVFSYELVKNSPKKISSYFQHLGQVYARDRYTVVYEFREFHAEWAYQNGYGYYNQIVPRETADIDRNDWRNVVGTGPFTLENYIQGNLHHYQKNPRYWDKERIGEQRYPIPFVDALNYRIIKDEATQLTALRTARIDILEVIRWIVVDHLKESTPELQWKKTLANVGTFLAMRVDQPPFDDIRVRRALNLAVNQQEILDAYYGGHAELMAYPQHPDFGEYFEPLESMPESIKELFSYQPDKAKQLLAEAGYPDGFSFKTQVCSCNPNHMDLLPLIASYLERVGVTVEIETMEYASFLSMMTTKNHGPGYMMDNGHTNPTTSLRKSFNTGQLWNPSNYSSPWFDEELRKMYLNRNEGERVQVVHELTRFILDEAPYIWLPIGYYYTAWWPWVKNYGGELRAGANRPGPVYARIWIDREMKKEMGFE